MKINPKTLAGKADMSSLTVALHLGHGLWHCWHSHFPAPAFVSDTFFVFPYFCFFFAYEIFHDGTLKLCVYKVCSPWRRKGNKNSAMALALHTYPYKSRQNCRPFPLFYFILFYFI